MNFLLCLFLIIRKFILTNVFKHPLFRYSSRNKKSEERTLVVIVNKTGSEKK